MDPLSFALGGGLGLLLGVVVTVYLVDRIASRFERVRQDR